MLAYDEQGKFAEFVEKKGIAVCSHCHRLYHQYLRDQVPGFREREYDECPYCGYQAGSSMSHDFLNSKMSSEEICKMERKSLLDSVVKYCHQQYISTHCSDCDHDDHCPGNPCGNCKQCLEEVHYPTRYANGRRDYECNRMLDFYVCDYTAKYASEMLYLMRRSKAMQEIEKYHVLSIGCGACPDLMALERYCHEQASLKTVSYLGIDINERWKRIHEVISDYKTSTIRKSQFWYKDAVTDKFTIPDANVVVLQYVISHFYNNGQIVQIKNFFQKLINTIIAHKQKEVPMTILINDVNSNNRGRDYFLDLIEMMQASNIHGRYNKYYFDYKIVHSSQQYGEMHESNKTIFELPDEFERIYQPWHLCSSAQLLIEVL